ncbi:MAG: M14 family zinc carboxypeptidase [Armatimonadota bacterium]
MRLDRFIILIITIFVCAILIYRVTIHHNSRQGFEQKLLSLNSSAYARTFKIGSSVNGKAIYAVSLTDPTGLGQMQDRVRIMIVSGQHTNERTPIQAVLQVIDDLADTKDPHKRKMLKEAVVVMIPVANPDVFDMWGRYNAHGIDLNRDWASLSQPETRAIEGFASKFRPHIAVDSHEGQPNRVEVPSYGPGKIRMLTMLLAQKAASSTDDRSLKLVPKYNSPNLSKGLMHRHFASEGICSMLLESPMDIPSKVRQPVYIKFYHKLIETAAFPPNKTISSELSSIMQKNGRPTLDLASKYAVKPKRASNSVPDPLGVIIGALILCYSLNRACSIKLV